MTLLIKVLVAVTLSLMVVVLVAYFMYYNASMSEGGKALTYTDVPDEQGFCGTVIVSKVDGATLASFRICEDSIKEAYETKSEYVVLTEGGRMWKKNKLLGFESFKTENKEFSGSFTKHILNTQQVAQHNTEIVSALCGVKHAGIVTVYTNSAGEVGGYFVEAKIDTPDDVIPGWSGTLYDATGKVIAEGDSLPPFPESQKRDEKTSEIKRMFPVETVISCTT